VNGFARFGFNGDFFKRDPPWKRSAVPTTNGHEAPVRNNLMWGGGGRSMQCSRPERGEGTLFLGSPIAALAQRDCCSAFRHFPPLLRTSTIILFVLPSLVSSTLFSYFFYFFNLPFILHFHKSFCCCCCSCSSSSASPTFLCFENSD
jgi:hypothetical protein